MELEGTATKLIKMSNNVLEDSAVLIYGSFKEFVKWNIIQQKT